MNGNNINNMSSMNQGMNQGMNSNMMINNIGGLNPVGQMSQGMNPISVINNNIPNANMGALNNQNNNFY